MSGKNNMTLGEAINRMIDEFKLRPRINEARIRTRWSELMGVTIARHTQRIALKNGKLYIQISSAPLKNELLYSRDKIKEIFNQEFQEEVVTQVIIY
ncbi:MAG: DUF721 domain-containing protein [Chitinophagales bacterium]|nr:DUF721 domain-containing protein [Chitinophagales bacterium]MDW8418850.1 DUF721 domain-containing protein [Chitinophagales bacterium]